MSLAMSIIGSLIRQKSLGPLATLNGRCSRMYVIFLIIVIIKTAIAANTCKRLYATSRFIYRSIFLVGDVYSA